MAEPRCRRTKIFKSVCDCGYYHSERINRDVKRVTFNSTAFQDKPQRNDSSITNTYFNASKDDRGDHGHVKHRDNPDGSTSYLYVRDVEGNEYDV